MLTEPNLHPFIEPSKYYEKPKHEQTHAVSTWAADSVDFNLRPDTRCPAYRLLHQLVSSPLTPFWPLPMAAIPMSDDEYSVFANLAPDEAEWSELEELFKAHGYNFRPRLRKGWTPSWLTTGKSPLQSEDGEMLRVHRLLYRLTFHADDTTDPPG